MTPVVRVLLIANVAAFFAQQTLPGFDYFLTFRPHLAFVRPWTAFTYMFLHGSFTHIAFNMLALFFFGPRVEDRMGSRAFTIMWFVSGLCGALLSMVFSSASIIGASAGTFGVMMAFAYYWPNAPIHIWGILPVPASVLVVVTTVIAIWSQLVGAGRGIAHFAHLGGYAGSFLYLKWLERKRGQFKRKVEAAPVAAAQRVEHWKSIDRAAVHEVNRDEVNRILDKINAQGIGALTSQERIFLSNFVPVDDRPPTVQ